MLGLHLSVPSASDVGDSGYWEHKRFTTDWRQGNRCIFVSFVGQIKLEVRPSGLGFLFSIASVHLPSASRWGRTDTGSTRVSLRTGATAIGAFWRSFVCQILEAVRPLRVRFCVFNFVCPCCLGICR